MKWFNNPHSLEELKKQYKQLALKNHPDIGGSNAAMQEINAEYEALFATLKDIHQTAEGKTYTCKTDETPDEFREIIETLLRFKGTKIEICGSWIWVTGNTIDYRAQLKEMKFRWSKSKVAWYFHRYDYRKRTGRTFSLDEIRDLYGSQTIDQPPELKLQIV